MSKMLPFCLCDILDFEIIKAKKRYSRCYLYVVLCTKSGRLGCKEW